MYTLFKNITSNCPEANCKTCESEELECYVLDNHGYVIIGAKGNTGKFFGEVRGSVMQRLVEERVYKPVRIYDYQAVCFASKETTNPANALKTVSLITFQVILIYFKNILLSAFNSHFKDFTMVCSLFIMDFNSILYSTS